MPFQRPTLSQLRQQVAADITSNIPGADGLLRFSNLNVIGTVQAGMANLHYGYLDWISKQSVPFTCTGEYLEAWAGLVGITRLAATAASGTATFTGTPGIVIPAGTLIVRGDQKTFFTAADVTIGGGGTGIVTATATVAGAAGNTSVSTVLSLAQAIAGVISNGSATTAFTGGADVEDDDSLRARMLERFAAPPQGGDQQDYVTWALAVPGVTRVWCLPSGMGAGTVVVYFMLDVTEATYSGFPQGTNGGATLETRTSPATGDQLAVANYIFTRQPVTALVYAVAPIAAPQNFTIKGLLPNTGAMQTSIAAAITDAFLRLGAANGGTVYMADIEGAINAIPGIIDFIITSPTTDITTTTGNLPTLGTITYI